MKRNDAQAFVRAHRMSTPHAAVGMSMAPGLHVSGSRISASWLQVPCWSPATAGARRSEHLGLDTCLTILLQSDDELLSTRWHSNHPSYALQACAMLLGLSTSSVALVAAASSTMQVQLVSASSPRVSRAFTIRACALESAVLRC